MEIKTESYSLVDKQLPTIPVPHDCIVKEISLQNSWLIFDFEDDISYHDSIRGIRPGAHGLTMRFRLTDEKDITILAREIRKYEVVYVERKRKKLFELAKKGRELEYLDHMAAYGFLQIELCSENSCILRLAADRVVMEWKE